VNFNRRLAHYCVFFRLELQSVVQSMYSSALNITTSKYFRQECFTSNYYYQALQINVSVSGDYELSSSSGIDTFGYLYANVFNTFHPLRNLITSNDDGCNELQFWLQYYLQANTTYILVVTTFNSNIMGSFQVVSKGVARVSFSLFGEFDDG
jgi:hypothetical protein